MEKVIIGLWGVGPNSCGRPFDLLGLVVGRRGEWGGGGEGGGAVDSDCFSRTA